MGHAARSLGHFLTVLSDHGSNMSGTLWGASGNTKTDLSLICRRGSVGQKSMSLRGFSYSLLSTTVQVTLHGLSPPTYSHHCVETKLFKCKWKQASPYLNRQKRNQPTKKNPSHWLKTLLAWLPIACGGHATEVSKADQVVSGLPPSSDVPYITSPCFLSQPFGPFSPSPGFGW